MNRWRFGLLGLAVSLLVAVFILSQGNIGAMIEAFTHARWAYLVPTIALLLAGLVARAVRWRVLLNGALPLGRAFHIMNVAYMVNGILPLRIGEVARMYLATRAIPPVPVFHTASTIIVERLLDLLAVVLLLVFAVAAGPVPSEVRAAAAVAGPVAFLGFLALIMLSSQRTLVMRLGAAVVGRLPRTGAVLPKLSVWFGQFLDGLLPLAKPRALLLALTWTAVAWSLSIAAGYVLMYTFYETASWAAACLYIAAVAFSVAVPALPANLGAYEGAILLALSAVGYGEPFEVAAAFALVVHGLNLALHVSTGVVGFMQEGISLGQLSKGVQEIRTQNGVVIPDEG